MITDSELRALITFDAIPVYDATLADLSVNLFAAYRQQIVSSEVIAENHRSIEEQLASLRMFDLRSSCPTVAGILLFGKNPRYFLPGVYVQYLKLPGETLAETPVDQAEISGDLLSVLRELDIRTKTSITTRMIRVSTLREQLVPDYP